MTTMEEVFMKVGTDCDKTLDDQLKATYGGNGEYGDRTGYSEEDNGIILVLMVLSLCS